MICKDILRKPDSLSLQKIKADRKCNCSLQPLQRVVDGVMSFLVVAKEATRGNSCKWQLRNFGLDVRKKKSQGAFCGTGIDHPERL